MYTMTKYFLPHVSAADCHRQEVKPITKT